MLIFVVWKTNHHLKWKKEGNETVTSCNALKLEAADGIGDAASWNWEIGRLTNYYYLCIL